MDPLFGCDRRRRSWYSRLVLVGWAAALFPACSGENGPDGSGPPSAPVNLSAVAGNRQVALSWSAGATDDEVAGYNIYTHTSAAVGPNSFMSDSSGTSSSLAWTVPNLINGTTYYFVVTGVNPAGEGPPSAAVSAIPTNEAPPGTLSAPVVAGTADGNLVTLTWSAVPNAWDYEVGYECPSMTPPPPLPPGPASAVTSSLTFSFYGNAPEVCTATVRAWTSYYNNGVYGPDSEPLSMPLLSAPIDAPASIAITGLAVTVGFATEPDMQYSVYYHSDPAITDKSSLTRAGPFAASPAALLMTEPVTGTSLSFRLALLDGTSESLVGPARSCPFLGKPSVPPTAVLEGSTTTVTVSGGLDYDPWFGASAFQVYYSTTAGALPEAATLLATLENDHVSGATYGGSHEGFAFDANGSPLTYYYSYRGYWTDGTDESIGLLSNEASLTPSMEAFRLASTYQEFTPRDAGDGDDTYLLNDRFFFLSYWGTGIHSVPASEYGTYGTTLEVSSSSDGMGGFVVDDVSSTLWVTVIGADAAASKLWVADITGDPAAGPTEVNDFGEPTQAIVADESNVYVLTSATVAAIAKTDLYDGDAAVAPLTLATTLTYPYAPFLQGTTLFFAQSDGLYEVSTSGGGASLVASFSGVTTLTSDGTAVYFINDEAEIPGAWALWAFDRSSPQDRIKLAEPLFNGYDLALWGTRVLWTDASNVYTYDTVDHGIRGRSKTVGSFAQVDPTSGDLFIAGFQAIYRVPVEFDYPVAPAPASAPQAPVATASDRALSVSWSPVEYAEAYLIYEETGGPRNTHLATARTYGTTLQDLTNGTEYQLGIYAANLQGTGPGTAISATPVIGKPSAMWLDPSDQAVDVTVRYWGISGYETHDIELYWSTTPNVTTANDVLTATFDFPDYVFHVPGLINGQAYYFNARVVDTSTGAFYADSGSEPRANPAHQASLLMGTGGPTLAENGKAVVLSNANVLYLGEVNNETLKLYDLISGPTDPGYSRTCSRLATDGNMLFCLSSSQTMIERLDPETGMASATVDYGATTTAAHIDYDGARDRLCAARRDGQVTCYGATGLDDGIDTAWGTPPETEPALFAVYDGYAIVKVGSSEIRSIDLDDGATTSLPLHAFQSYPDLDTDGTYGYYIYNGRLMRFPVTEAGAAVELVPGGVSYLGVGRDTGSVYYTNNDLYELKDGVFETISTGLAGAQEVIRARLSNAVITFGDGYVYGTY